MVKWLGAESSFLKVPVLGEDIGADVAKRAHLELDMKERAHVYLGDVKLWRILNTSVDEEPIDHATTVEGLTDSTKYERISAGKLKEDVNGSWLLVTPPFVPLSGEGVGGVVQRGEGMVAT